MALLPKKYNTPENKAGMDDRTPLPAGSYPVHIVKTEMKQTKAKTGHYLSVQFKVLAGAAKGRVLFENLNLDNPNPVAVEIADKTLNSICQACGKPGVEDSQELHNIPMLVTVIEDLSNPQYPGNSIKAFEYLDPDTLMHDTPPVSQAPAQTETPPPAETVAPAATKLPWQQ